VRAWVPLAGKALSAARDRDYDRASRAIHAISVRYGEEQIPWVMLAWIDTMATACGLRPQPGAAVGVLWQHESGGAITEADDTPPAVRWAGRAVAARLADDYGQFEALVNSCSGDQEWSANVGAVLDICASMLRKHAGESS
jgi:hypothetical protein